MIRQREAERLIKLLAGYGYEGKALEEGVRAGVDKGGNFTAGHQMAFGDELMDFNFYFIRDLQFDAYRLNILEATHHQPIHIEKENINGIDTAKLEDVMRSVDWDEYPFNEFEQGKIHDRHILEIFDKLEALRKGGEEGMLAADLLYLKYLPEDYHGSDRLLEINDRYNQTTRFEHLNEQIPNANLAYHTVSGKFQELQQQLLNADMEGLPGVDIYDALEKQFSNKPGGFTLIFHHASKEDFTTLSIPVGYIDGQYTVNSYSLFLIPYPPVQHGVYLGVDTAELEHQMERINWKRAEDFMERQTGLVYNKTMGDITGKLSQLRDFPDSAHIADLLIMKYWWDNKYVDPRMIRSAREYLDSLPCFSESFTTIRPDLALQLLRGKPVAGGLLYPDKWDAPEWIRLDFSKRDKTGHYPEIAIDRLSEARMKELLLPLNYEKYGFFDTLYLMRCGKTAKIVIDDKHYCLEAVPEQDTFRLTDKGHQEIPFNFSLSPDWTPQSLAAKETIILRPEKTVKHSFQKKKTTIKKGKGL